MDVYILIDTYGNKDHIVGVFSTYQKAAEYLFLKYDFADNFEIIATSIDPKPI